MIKKGVIISIMIIFLLTARIVAYQEEKVELPNLFVNPLGFFLQILGLDNMGEAGDGYGCGDGSCDGNKNLNNCPDDCKEEIKDSKDKKAYKKNVAYVIIGLKQLVRVVHGLLVFLKMDVDGIGLDF